MRRSRAIAAAVLVLLLLAGVVSRLLQAPAVEVAKAACAERGWQADGLKVAGFRQTGDVFFGEWQTVDVLGAGPEAGRRARVGLHRPAYFLGWRVVDWQDQPQGQ
jgi:hypothetical protein